MPLCRVDVGDIFESIGDVFEEEPCFVLEGLSVCCR